jgi:hypothetical protein
VNAASYRFLVLIAEFDREEHWVWYGVATCAQWLNWQCGLGEVAAREHVRVARALPKLPKISESFSRGELSYSKVRAMTRIATPENEEVLLNIALHGTAAQLCRLVSRYRRYERLEEARDPEKLYRQRYVRFTYDEDGSMILHAKLPPELGEVVKKAIEVAVETQYRDDVRGRSEATREVDAEATPDAAQDAAQEATPGSLQEAAQSSSDMANASATETKSNVSAEAQATAPQIQSQSSAEARWQARNRSILDDALDARRNGVPFRSVPGSSAAEELGGEEWPDTIGRRRADALRLLAEQFLCSSPLTRGSSADRYQVVVHIDQRLLSEAKASEAFAEAASDTDLVLERCELDDGRALALEVARRLACDCSLVGIVEDEEGEPLSVGRKTRSIPPAMARALNSRDGGCRFPGCGRTLFTEGHHVVHWANGGETKLSNLVTLCTFHHRLLHDGGFGLRATPDGGFAFTRPDGTLVEPSGDRRARDILANLSSRPASGEPTRSPSLFGINRAHGIEIDHRTAAARWIGDKLDYGWTVEHLIYCRDGGRRQAAH